MINRHKSQTVGQLVAGSMVLVMLLAVSLTGFAAPQKNDSVGAEKAEMMGRVEDFFLHNFRDVTARKSVEWSDVKTDSKQNPSIRYMYEALIWDKEWKIMNQVFTFDTEGKFVSVKDVAGYPKAKEPENIDTTTKKGMMALVEKFFSRNYRDITARKTIEWGEVETTADGNRSIRYRYEATIWDKDKIERNKVFTFTPDGEFVSVKDVPAGTGGGDKAGTSPAADIKTGTPQETIAGFTYAAAVGDVDTAMQYVLPGGTDYEDIREVLTASPSDTDKYQLRQLFEAIDINVPVKITSKQEKQNGDLSVVWTVTFKKAFKLSEKGQELVFKPGSTFELDATLRKTERGWLIENM